MSNANQRYYTQIVELTIAIKKKLCTTWRSEQLDKQAISDLKFAINKKKVHLNQKEKSDLDQILSDFENWVYEADADEAHLKTPMDIAKPSIRKKLKANTQTTL